jgi:hypothetical protein
MMTEEWREGEAGLVARNRAGAFLLVSGSFLVTVILTFGFFGPAAYYWLGMGGPFHHPVWFGICSFASVVASVACGLLVARLVARACFKWWRVRVRLVPKSRWVTGPLLAAYLLTWAVGVPQVQSANTSWAIDHSVGIVEDPQLGRIHYPFVQTYVSLPLLPFVVASLHENQTACLAGWSAWDFQLWYGVGTYRLFRMTLTVS